MTIRHIALALGIFGALLLTLTFAYAWQNDMVVIAVIGTVAGAIVAALLLKALPPRGGGRR